MKLNKLKGKLKENKLSYLKCAKALGISVTTFNNKVNGINKFYIEEVEKLSDFIGMTMEEKIDIFLN